MTPGPVGARRARGQVVTGMILGCAVSPLALGVSTTAIALPAVSEHLSLSRPQAAWLLAAYLLAQSMCVSVFGRLADLRGLRWVLLWGAVLLAAGSALAATAPSFVVVVAGRVLQGMGAGAVLVSTFGIVGSAFSPGERPRVLGVMTAFIGVVSGSGTLIGGLLTDLVSWRAVIALPALTVVAIGACLPLTPARALGGGRLDLPGAGLVASAAAAVILLLEAPSMHYAPGILAAIVAAVVILGSAVVLWIRRTPDGFVPRTLARDRTFAFAAVGGLTIYAAYVATLFAVPLLLVARHDWTATEVGLALLPAAAFGLSSAWIVGRLSTTYDPFRIAAALAAASAGGLVLAGVGDGAPVPSVVGLALALAGVTGANVSLVARVPMMAALGVRNVATGLFTLVFQIGGALGTAMVAGLDDPLGGAAALASVAVLPAVGSVLVLAAGRARAQPDQAGQLEGTDLALSDVDSVVA